MTLILEKHATCCPPLKHHLIHQIHAAGGVGGSITMVMVFVRSFVLFVWFQTCDLSVGLVVHEFQRCNIVTHPGLHHTKKHADTMHSLHLMSFV